MSDLSDPAILDYLIRRYRNAGATIRIPLNEIYVGGGMVLVLDDVEDHDRRFGGGWYWPDYEKYLREHAKVRVLDYPGALSEIAQALAPEIDRRARAAEEAEAHRASYHLRSETIGNGEPSQDYWRGRRDEAGYFMTRLRGDTPLSEPGNSVAEGPGPEGRGPEGESHA